MYSLKNLIAALVLIISVDTQAQNSSYDICPIKNSEEVPEATVYSIEGKELNLKDYVGEKSAVIVFYRGGWCPYCMRHLSALQEIKSDIDRMGYELIAIAPDDFSNLDKTIENSKGIDYTLISDKNANAINAFGIGWTVDPKMFEKYKNEYSIDLESWSGDTHHVLPVPAVFVVEKGKIKYQHVDPNYSQRLSGEVLLSYLEN